MLEFEEKNILEDLRKAFKNNAKNKVVNLDEAPRKKLDCFVMRLEKLLAETGYEISPHRQSKFTLIYITKGKGKKIIGSAAVPIKNKVLIFIPSRITSSAIYSNKEIKGYYLSLGLHCFLEKEFPWNQLLQLNLFNPTLTPYFYADNKLAKIIEEIFETILFEVHHQNKNRKYLIAGKIIELLILCDRMFKTGSEPAQNSNPPLVVQYISLIQEHYKIHHSATYYAEKLHVHPNSLNANAKRYLGQSAKAIIDTKLLTEAQYLLKQTTLSVKEIAYDLGFQSASHFFRFFKRHTGDSPIRYRHTHLNL